jgi:putative restriction endonuclease
MALILWTRDELILALNLYLKLPFGKLHSRTPEIIYLAELIGRTPGSIAMRLNNFASVDPFHQQRGIGGLPGGRKQVEPIWNEFIDNKEELLYESERILAELENKTIETKYAGILKGTENLKGETKVREVKTRVNQYVFRDIVIANYSGKCAVTGIDIPKLLIASHIIPWSENEKERLNPENGICLSPLYDSAFDKGYLAIDPSYKIVLSKQLKQYTIKTYYNCFFGQYENKLINLPAKYPPNKDFLKYHSERIFKK